MAKLRSCVVVEEMPARFKIAKYNSKGEVVAVRWAKSKWRANEMAKELGYYIIQQKA